MDLHQVIIGPVTTEKSERRKASHGEYAIKVNPKATKIDIKSALRAFYDLDVESVRIIRVPIKVRSIGRGRTMEKRHPYKKALITLGKESKNFDLASFKK